MLIDVQRLISCASSIVSENHVRYIGGRWEISHKARNLKAGSIQAKASLRRSLSSKKISGVQIAAAICTPEIFFPTAGGEVSKSRKSTLHLRKILSQPELPMLLINQNVNSDDIAVGRQDILAMTIIGWLFVHHGLM